MQDHLHFGAPPKLRPRTAGASRSSLAPNDYDYATTTTSTSTSAPERLASAVNASKQSPSLLLRQRLQSPRPGSAAPQQTPRATGAAACNGDKGVFMKPPMRPKSANAASRQVSRHRMQLVQDPSTSNQHEDTEFTSGKEDAVRTAVKPPLSYSKRPFSAAAASSASSNRFVGIPIKLASARAESGLKRPHSAAASTRYQPFRAREKSSASLTSCLSVVSHAVKAPRSMSASSSRSGHSRGDRLMASTRDQIDNTFVYAVPRHCLEPGLQYDPYDIISVTHETLFGGGSINQMQEANWDYYTISQSGYTFHVKNDGFQSTFLSLSNWETQKTQFSKLRGLSTFSAFRYRKVFVGWRQWVRYSKREAAREKLISECYFSYPILLKGMKEIRNELAKLSKLLLMWNFDGETVSLENFTIANAKFIKSRTKELRQINTRIQNVLAGVCQVFLDDTAPLHAGFPGHEFALSVRKSSNFHILESYTQCEHGLASAHQQLMQHKHFRSMRLTTSDAAEARAALVLSSIEEHGKEAEKVVPRPAPEVDELEDIRWTMASIKRRKCKQLTKFMMLIDFLLLDTFTRVVKQSLDLLSSFVLHGANAETVMKLINRDDLTLATHQAISAVRRNSIQHSGEASVDTSGSTQIRQIPLTRLQIKALLHAAWEGKFRTSSSAEDETAALSGLSVMTMENRLEALFFHALSKHTGPNTETFSVDDLFYVVDNFLAELLVLPHFTTANMSIYTNEVPTNLNNDNLLEQEVLAIPCLSHQPLFSLDVATTAISEKRGRRSYEMCFKPELTMLVRTLQSIIIGFTEVFREVPSLLSSPELRSVLEFADDIRALNLHAAFTTNSSQSLARRRARFPSELDNQADKDDVTCDNGDQEHFRSPADRLLGRLEEDGHYLSIRDEIQDLTRSVLHGASEFAACYSKVLELRQQNESVNFDIKARQFRRNEYTLDQMKQDFTRFTDQLVALEALRLSTDVEFLHFDMRQLQADLLPSPARCLDTMHELLPRLAREKCDQFLQYIHTSSAKIEKTMVPDLDAFTKYLLNLREVYDEILDKELDLTFLHDFFSLLYKLKFDAPLETAKIYDLCDPEFQALKSHVNEAYASRDMDIHNYTPLLTENLGKLKQRMSWLESAASNQEMEAQRSTCEEARDNAVKLYSKATEMQQEANRLTHIQKVFEEAANDVRPPGKTFEDLDALSAVLKLKSELWEAVCEADKHLNECSTDTIRSVDLDKMGIVASHVDLVLENIRQCTSQVVGNFELDRLEKLQATLHGLAPVIRDLRNDHLAERHWSKLEHKMQCSLTPISTEVTENPEVEEQNPLEATDSTETLVNNRLDLQIQQLLDVNAVVHATTIRHVSEEASAEAAIAGSFMSVVRTWEAQEIPIEPKKDRDGRDVYCVGDCIELTSLIEESQVLLRVMDLSTYSLVVQEKLPKMLHDLEHTKESLELLQMCQRKWDYTQRLVSIDFARTFPEQAKHLQKHDTTWKTLTLGLSNRSLCLPFGVSSDHRQTLQGILEGFEAAAKTLADHLEIKRQVFPVFFQLSDVELATLLSKCRDVNHIPSFLYQCFDNIGQIVFGTRDAFQDILQITSRAYGQAEKISMGKNLKARGPVEQWLAAIEKRLAEQLRRSTKQTIEILSCHNERSIRDIDHFPVQSILLADRVVRCVIIENGLKDMINMGNNKFDQVNCQLETYSSNVKDQILPFREPNEVPVLTPREISLRAGLCLQEIHFRDAFASHVASQQSGLISRGGLAIEWEYQLKYRMDDATTVGYECHVEMNTLNIPYGFNYMNPSQDSVVTPSSLRSLFSLFACVRHAQGCLLTGPSESGKHSLSMQVSSMLGRRSFSAAVSCYTHAKRLLIGALYAGGTFCASLQFKASLEASAALIKTLATTLASIELAVLTKTPIVGLHRSPVTFVPGTAMIAILPSTLQLSTRDTEDIKIWTECLSRFVVVQWDWMYIFEALLMSKGFVESRDLAKNLLIMWQDVRSSFDLARGKASTTNSSPFSYSALKTIIADAASKFDVHPCKIIQDHQNMLIHQAILQYFHARIDADQFKILGFMVENVFSSNNLDFQLAVQKKEPTISLELQECVNLALRELHYVPRKILLDAVSSLADALTFNTSAVLVGPFGVGKSASYQVLARALKLCLQRRNQTVLTPDQEPTKAQQSEPIQARAKPIKRSNSFLTPKTEKNLPASVAIHVVLPMALSVTQLYGGISLDAHGRIPSIMGQLIREAQEIYVPNCTTAAEKSLLDLHNQVWVIFDDVLDIRWLEGLLTILKSTTQSLLPFGDGEFLTLPPNLRIIFEVLEIRDATPSFLHANAILPLNSDKFEGNFAATKTGSRRTKIDDVWSQMTIATAYLHRYVELQREQTLLLTVNTSNWSPLDMFNVVERWLLKSSLLAKLTTVLDDNSEIVNLSQLQRVTNLTSMLQSLLSTASSLPEPGRTNNKMLVSFPEDLPHGQIRVEMALIYSLLWGFAACTGSHATLQWQLSDMVKREFEHLTPAWRKCGTDVNLFGTLLDLQELRFVPVVSTSGQTILLSQVTNSSFGKLFVPTASSLVVHAAIKEALRSGRGILLLGGESSRRTTLARNFLGQLDVIRNIIATGGVSNADKEADKARKPIGTNKNEAATLASVKRLRLRQITLVTCMALRLQKDTNEVSDSLQASQSSIATTSDNQTVLEAEEGVPLAIYPSTDLGKTAMVRQFDRGDIIPFFFAMPHSNSNTHSGNIATELANCLERMLQRERTGVFEPPPGKIALLILDDLHLALPDEEPISYPSVYAYLRYVQERRTVYHGSSCLPTSVDNLMLFASMRVENFPSEVSTPDETLRKLTSKFFPILASTCELEELNHIFGQTLQIQWGSNTKVNGVLAITVQLAIPLVVAATTVLWDRLRSTYKFCLQDLARVYEGLAGVGPSLLSDMETLLRLWTHECNRTLREPSMGFTSKRQDEEVCDEISRMRASVSQVAQRRASARASRLSMSPEAGLSFTMTSKRQSIQAAQPVYNENASAATLLTLFAARSSTPTPNIGKLNIKFSQQFISFQEQLHHAAMVGGLWAYVPANIYYGGASTILRGETQDVTGSKVSESLERVYRRSSASLMRRKSLETGVADTDAFYRSLRRHGPWIYAEISFENDNEVVSTAAVQVYYRELRTFSSTISGKINSTSLPRDVSPVPFNLAQLIARIDRVYARSAARLILLDNSSSAVETLLRFATFSRMSEVNELTQTNGAILTLSGLPEDPKVVTNSDICSTMRWKRLLLELYERVGVSGQEATLVVKRLDLLPIEIINQLQALMTTGEVPGTFSLAEQVHLATRVCDERLLEMKAKHAVQVAQIRAEVEATRDEALAILHQQQRDAPTTPLLEEFQRVETQFQRDLRSKLARVDLRWQQDSDDLRREREVESESVAATVMALTRPLGVTSGKWASAVARMCSKLRVVLLIDTKHEKQVRFSSPNLFTTCDVVSVPQLDRESLRTLIYGHFHAPIQQLIIDHKGTSPKGLTEFLYQVQQSIWTIICMATDMHLAVVDAFAAQNDVKEENVAIVRAFAIASIFAKLIVDNYKREEAVRAKASWFLELSNRLDRDLGALRSSDIILNEQLTSIDQQLTTHSAKLVEQKEDAERIRLIMQRFQVAADEQILVTNEAQEVAQRELKEPMMCLEEANRALLLVDRRHIVEIKSFVNPPPLVHLVLGAVCVLFQLEPSWESARRLLLGDANVVQTLLQFNKDAVTTATLTKLEVEFLRDGRFQREEVERQSVAAATMVGWVRAIYQYSSARHQVQPTLDKLEKAQSRLNLIMKEFQVSKQRVVEADGAWQATQAAIDAAITRKEALAVEISSLGARCGSGEQAMEALQEDRKRQQEAASASSMRRGFSLTSWNTLLSAGTLAYACELSHSSRRALVFKAWEAAYCSYGGLTPGCPPTSTCCSFVPSISVVLKANSSSDNQSETPLTALFAGDYPDIANIEAEETLKLVTGVAELGFSKRRLWDASLLSLIAASSALPVVMITQYSIDMEELLVTCARRVWNWNNLHMVYARAADFDDEFRLAASLGHQLLVLDVQPMDSEPTEHGIHLYAALSWKTSRIDGVEHLLIPRKSSETDLESEENTEDTTTTDSIALHPNFRLILTSYATQAAFGEVLDMIPTLDGQLHPNDMADVMLDKVWSSSCDSPDALDNTGGFKLKTALQEHGDLAEQYETSYTQLTKRLEAAAVTSQLPLAQTHALRERLGVVQEARQVLRDKRRQIQEQLGLVKRQCTAFARTGAAVFNAFNVTISNSGPNASPPLTLKVFLPILLDAVAPSYSTSSSSTPTVPVLLTRTATCLGLTSSQLSSVDALAKLLTRIAPFVPPTSPNGDWYRFLIQVITSLEEMHPTTKMTHHSVHESEDSHVQAAENTPRSVSSILLQAKLQRRSKYGTLSSLISAETCMKLVVSNTQPDLQLQIVSIILYGCKNESDIDDIFRLALPEASSRCDRLSVSLVLFPELVHHVCDRVLAGHGVPLNFHHRRINTSAKSDDGKQEGFWLRTIREIPEQTAVLLYTRHEFHSFAFAKRVFFHGIDESNEIQIRVLQELGERKFRVSKKESKAKIDSDEFVPISQLYVLPRYVHPPEEQHEEAVRQLLLIADDFKQVLRMEKAQLETLEEIPLAVINMKIGVPENWEALFQILHRTCHRATSADLQRHDNINSISEADNQPVKRTGIESAGTSTQLTNTRTQRRSSQSMIRRISAIDLVTPTYPRLVAVIDNLTSLPVHLRSNIVCFRDELEDDFIAPDTNQTPLLSKYLQSTVLRFTLYPCVQTLSALTQPSEDDIGSGRSTPPDLWVVISGLVLFHAMLVFRSQVLRSTYIGALPSTYNPAGTGSVFHYNDDVFLTAIKQCLAVLVEKQHHYNNQQRRRTGRNPAFTDVFERRIFQQIVLSSYTRLAAGHQEMAFLKKLFIECLQVVGWNENSVGEQGIRPQMPSILGSSRQMSIRQRPSISDGLSSMAQPSSRLLIKRTSSVSITSPLLPLGFLAFPSEGLRQVNLTLSQWLELVWTYSSSIDQQMNGKLQALLLGQQPNNNRRGSLEESSRDLMGTSNGIGLAYCPPPKWIRAFGWANNHTASLGDAAELVPLRTAIEVVQAIVAEALPPRFNLESWNQVENNDQDKEKQATSVQPEVEPTLKTMVAVYNLHIDTCSTVLKDILNHLFKHGNEADTMDIPTDILHPQLEEGDENESDDSEEESDEDEDDAGNSSYIIDIEDINVRQQMVAILHNEIPPNLLDHSSLTATWSLHDLLQHYQDWHGFFAHLQPHDPPKWWLPALLACNLPIAHVLEVAKKRYSSQNNTVMQFTLQLVHENDSQPPSLPENSFGILDGVVLFGATWNRQNQHLDRVDELKLHHHVQIIFSLSSENQPTTSTMLQVPLLATHDGSLLLECALAMHPTRVSALSTPFLIPLGSHFR